MQFVLQERQDPNHDFEPSDEDGATIIIYPVTIHHLEPQPDHLLSLVTHPAFAWAKRRGFTGRVDDLALIPLSGDHAAILIGITPEPAAPDAHSPVCEHPPNLDDMRETFEALPKFLKNLGPIAKLHIHFGSIRPLSRELLDHIGRGLGLGAMNFRESELNIDEIWIHGKGDFSPTEKRQLLDLLRFRYQEPHAEWNQP